MWQSQPALPRVLSAKLVSLQVTGLTRKMVHSNVATFVDVS